MQDPDSSWAGTYVGSVGFASNEHVLDKHKVQPPESSDNLLKPAKENLGDPIHLLGNRSRVCTPPAS